MTQQTGNLSNLERALSALFGMGLSLLALRRGNPAVRAVTGALGASLIARSAVGHCAVKAAMLGHSSLREGVADQLRGMTNTARAHGLPGSPVHTEKSQAVDEAGNESFPASDPPASRIPDEPPVNAEAKWAAARAADPARKH